jgi:radical SAM superfamily enzyme YgiQ (UPF0313 family)
MDYVGSIFRPPSEADSLLLQVTVGCSHNRCAFCAMYLDKRFKPKPWDRIDADLQEAAQLGPVFRRVFLCDGDALILSSSRLLQILSSIRKHLPWVERVGVYGDTRSIGPKTVSELKELRAAGLGMVYHGMESGDDEVLRRIDKGGTAVECIDAATKLREAGIVHSVIALLGIGGTALSEQHARNTAAVLSKMDPRYAAALTVTIVPGTPLFEQQQRGRFTLPSKFDFLQELRTIVADSNFTRCRFSTNHASNYLPLRGDLPEDKAHIVAVLDEVLAHKDERLLRPEFMRGL